MAFLTEVRRLFASIIRSHPVALNEFRKLRDWLEWKKPAQRTPEGFLIKGPAAMRSGVFEREEVEFLQSLKDSFDVFVNVGANIGYFCLLASGMGKRVVAVEASPKNFSRLIENLASNNVRDIEVFPIACGSGPAMSPIYGHGVVSSLLPGWSGSDTRPVAYVPVHTLDRLALPTVQGHRSLILVDVEGFELEVIQGAREILRSEPSPIWLVEICLKEHQPDLERARKNSLRVFQLFAEFGYSAYALDKRPVCIGGKDFSERHLEEFSNVRNFVFAKNQTALLSLTQKSSISS